MIVTEEDIYNIYSNCYNTKKSKGRKKQQAINNTTIDILKREYNPKYKYKREYKVEDVYGGFFKVDVAVFDENKNLVEIVLIKAPASNIKQNHKNSLNAQTGEYCRPDRKLYPNLKILQILFLPNVTPYLNKEAVIKNFETNKTIFITECDPLFKFDISETHIMFDIVGIENCKTKADVENLFMEDPMTKFVPNPISNISVRQSSYTREIEIK